MCAFSGRESGKVPLMKGDLAGSRCVAFFYCPEAPRSPTSCSLPFCPLPSIKTNARLHHHRCPKKRNHIPLQLPDRTSPDIPRIRKRTALLRPKLPKRHPVVRNPISPKINTEYPYRRSQSLLPLSSPSTPTPAPTLSPGKTNRTAEKPRNQSHIPLPSRNQAGI